MVDVAPHVAGLFAVTVIVGRQELVVAAVIRACIAWRLRGVSVGSRRDTLRAAARCNGALSGPHMLFADRALGTGRTFRRGESSGVREGHAALNRTDLAIAVGSAGGGQRLHQLIVLGAEIVQLFLVLLQAGLMLVSQPLLLLRSKVHKPTGAWVVRRGGG